LEESFADTVEDDNLLPDEVLGKLEDAQFLNSLLSRLPPPYQEVLTLYYQEDMTFKEIGEVLGKPLNTVKSHHYRAIEQLKKMAEQKKNAPK
jgi:RNA polymerase sigma factor (sigma-70 family)